MTEQQQGKGKSAGEVARKTAGRASAALPYMTGLSTTGTADQDISLITASELAGLLNTDADDPLLVLEATMAVSPPKALSTHRKMSLATAATVVYYHIYMYI